MSLCPAVHSSTYGLCVNSRCLTCLIVGKEVQDKNFIDSVLNFDAETLTASTIKTLKKKYIQNEAFEPEKIARASKAAAPLCIWARAQVEYAQALAKTKPLRKEVAALEAELAKVQAEFEAAMALVDLGSVEGIRAQREALVELERTNKEAEDAHRRQEEEREAAEAAAEAGRRAAAEAERAALLEQVAAQAAENVAAEAAVKEAAEEVAVNEAARAAAAAERDAATAELPSPEARQALFAEVEGLQGELVAALWEMFDTDQNGVLDKQEVTALVSDRYSIYLVSVEFSIQ